MTAPANRPPKAADPYWFDPGFERAVVTLCCCRPRFHGRIGHALDPECLELAEAKLALRAAHAVAKGAGRGPDNLVIVLQRLRQWMGDGRVTLEEIQAVADLFDEAESARLPTEEAAVAELAPVLRKRLQGDLVRMAMEEYAAGGGQDGSFAKTARLLHRATTLGDADTSVGVRLGSGSYEEIERVKGLERRPLGILELDQALSGGQRRGSLLVYVGGPGGGKSMAMSHGAAHDIRSGLFAAYATLEVPVPDVLARVKANLTGVPINAILEEPRCVEQALAAVPLGPFVVQEFTPLATTLDDIAAWVEALEEQEGRRVDVLYVDYGDKLGVPKTAGKDGEHGYTAGRVIFEGLRVYANEGHRGGKIWVVTGCQATRSKDKRKKIQLDDMADSMHKARVADLVVTINPDEEQLAWFIAKNRYGKANLTVGPLPHDFECGRVAPVLEVELTGELVEAARAALRLGGREAVTNLVLGRSLGDQWGGGEDE